jgi:hypothetical protein
MCAADLSFLETPGVANWLNALWSFFAAESSEGIWPRGFEARRSLHLLQMQLLFL